MSDKVISKISKKADYDLSTIAGRVKWKREKLGWQSNELAAKCNVPPTSINMLEMGKVEQPRYLKLLAEKLKTTEKKESNSNKIAKTSSKEKAA